MVKPKKKSVKDFWELEYSKGGSKNLRFRYRFAQWIFRKYFHPKGKILDMGCGSGTFYDIFKNMGFDVRGCDIVKLRKEFDRVNLDKDILPYPDNYFDYIFNFLVISHLKSPDNMFSEARRVLKKDGRILIYTLNWKRNVKNFWDCYSNKIPYTKQKIMDLMFLNNFDVMVAKEFRNIPYIWRWFDLAFEFPYTKKYLLIIGKKKA